MGGVIGAVASIGGSLLGAKSSRDAARSQEQAARESERQQAEIQALNRAFQKGEFEKQLSRQQPFVDVGTAALPVLSHSIMNRGRDVPLPAFEIQKGLILDALGETAPGFVVSDAVGDLEAIEQQKNIGRLADLVNIGLGGTGSEAAARMGLGTTLGQSLLSGQAAAGDTASALQQAAIQRANIQGQLVGGLAGLPAYAVQAGLFNQQPAQFSPLVPTTPSPLATTQNPLGLTPGQGL